MGNRRYTLMRMLFFSVFSVWTVINLHIVICAPEMEVIHSHGENDGPEAEGQSQLIPVGSRRYLWVENAYESYALVFGSQENSSMYQDNII